MDKWINTESIEYKLNKKFIKGSFFRSLPFRVQNSFKHASKFGHYDIDFCNVSESDGIHFISGNIDYLRRFPKIGNKTIQAIRDCLEKWKGLHQEEITQRDIDEFNAEPVEFEEAFENNEIERGNNV